MADFVSFEQFRDQLANAKVEHHFDTVHALATRSAVSGKKIAAPKRAEFSDDFKRIKDYLLSRYAGVKTCEHTFMDSNGNFVDCIPFEEHPAVVAAKKAKQKVASTAPDLTTVEVSPKVGAMERPPEPTPIMPPLRRGLVDPFGHLVASPEGCIPMRRITASQMARYGTFDNFFRKYWGRAPAHLKAAAGPKRGAKKPAARKTAKRRPVAPRAPGANEHLYAVCQDHNGGPYTGCRGGFNVWRPRSAPGVFSLAQLWIVGDSMGRNPETIESGWIVFPTFEGGGLGDDPVLFVYYNPDGYHDVSQGGRSGWVTGQNQLGFIPFPDSGWVIMGGGLTPSDPGRENQRAMHMLWQYFDGDRAGWYLYCGPAAGQYAKVGYFPAFAYAQGSALNRGQARVVQFGGEVCPVANSNRTGQMGSGIYPTQGGGEANFGEVAFCYQMRVQMGVGQDLVPAALSPYKVDDEWYGLVQPNDPQFNSFFFYGGAQAP